MAWIRYAKNILCNHLFYVKKKIIIIFFSDSVAISTAFLVGQDDDVAPHHRSGPTGCRSIIMPIIITAGRETVGR